MKTLSKLFLITMIIASLYAVLAVAMDDCLTEEGTDVEAGSVLEPGLPVIVE